jgi:hypothetical protein
MERQQSRAARLTVRLNRSHARQLTIARHMNRLEGTAAPKNEINNRRQGHTGEFIW